MRPDSAVSIAALDSHLARDCLVAALSQSQRLAPMPEVCARLAELSARQETDAAYLVSLVECDPAIAGEILRIANSPALRPRHRIVSLRRAVSWLGIAEVRNIAFAGALRGEVFNAPGHQPECESLWREARFGALWAREVAGLRRKHVETAYIAGLMHRVGAALALKLLSRFELEHRTAMDAHTFGELIAEFEPACGRLLMEQWRVTDEVQSAAVDWRAYGASRHADLAGTVNAAHLLAEHTLHPQLCDEEAVLRDQVFEDLGVSGELRAAMLSRRAHVRQIAA
ncbi:MAG: HDOD domain-containing protein [Gammaproteobacteria bacterium]|nr:HDOD domain-containing protein [Gammaproteobacteria bacterium]MDE2349309.1 HDOD domain-containing protein [Gammaproteobacteria bacterium]